MNMSIIIFPKHSVIRLEIFTHSYKFENGKMQQKHIVCKNIYVKYARYSLAIAFMRSNLEEKERG